MPDRAAVRPRGHDALPAVQPDLDLGAGAGLHREDAGECIACCQQQGAGVAGKSCNTYPQWGKAVTPTPSGVKVTGHRFLLTTHVVHMDQSPPKPSWAYMSMQAPLTFRPPDLPPHPSGYPQDWSITSRAGNLTYLAFVLAQVCHQLHGEGVRGSCMGRL